MHLLSIITINYNDSNGLEKTILSVVNQHIKRFEYIVIDGGSTDGSTDIIAKYADSIDYWKSERDSGIYDAMNKGVRAAHGKYCLMLNSGDELFNSKTISEVLPYLDSDKDYITGRELMMVKGKNRYLWHPPKRCDIHYLQCHSLRHQATFIKREILTEVPFDENLKLVSDWKQMLCAFVGYKATYISIPVVVDRCERIGATYNNKAQSLRERKETLGEICPDTDIRVSNFASTWYGLMYLRFCHLRGYIEAKLISNRKK